MNRKTISIIIVILISILIISAVADAKPTKRKIPQEYRGWFSKGDADFIDAWQDMLKDKDKTYKDLYDEIKDNADSVLTIIKDRKVPITPADVAAKAVFEGLKLTYDTSLYYKYEGLWTKYKEARNSGMSHKDAINDVVIPRYELFNPAVQGQIYDEQAMYYIFKKAYLRAYEIDCNSPQWTGEYECRGFCEGPSDCKSGYEYCSTLGDIPKCVEYTEYTQCKEKIANNAAAGTNYYWSSWHIRCINKDCPDGYKYNSLIGECEKEKKPNCPDGYYYDYSSGKCKKNKDDECKPTDIESCKDKPKPKKDPECKPAPPGSGQAYICCPKGSTDCGGNKKRKDDHADDKFDVSDATQRYQNNFMAYMIEATKLNQDQYLYDLAYYKHIIKEEGEDSLVVTDFEQMWNPIYMHQMKEVFTYGYYNLDDFFEENMNKSFEDNESLVYQNQSYYEEIMNSTDLIKYEYNSMFDQIIEVESELLDVAVLGEGSFEGAISILSSYNIPVSIVPSNFYGMHPEEFYSNFDVLFIPTGALMKVHSSHTFKDFLNQYTGAGGTLIVYSQQYGSHFSAVPGEVEGFGFQEDQSCVYNAVYINSYDEVLADQTNNLLSVNFDGYFTKIPDDAQIILSRSKNSQPAFIKYGYGAGTVYMITAYTDWAMDNYASTDSGKRLLKNIVTVARDGNGTKDFYTLTETINRTIEIKNDFIEYFDLYKYNLLDDNSGIPTHYFLNDSAESKVMIIKNITDQYLNLSEYEIIYQLYSYERWENGSFKVNASGNFIRTEFNETSYNFSRIWNDVNVTADKVKIIIFNDQGKIVEQHEHIISLSNNETINISVVPSRSAGIYFISYTLYKGQIPIKTAYDVDSYIIGRYEKNSNGGVKYEKEVTFDITSADEDFQKNTNGTFRFIVRNNGETERKIFVQYGFPHHTWEYRSSIYRDDNIYYGNFYDLRYPVNQSQFLTIPPGGSYEWAITIPIFTTDRLFANVYENASENPRKILGFMDRKIWAFNPSAEVNILESPIETYTGDIARLQFNINNKGASGNISYEIRLGPNNYDPEIVYLNKGENRTITKNLQIPSITSGVHILTVSAFDSGHNIIGKDSVPVEVRGPSITVHNVERSMVEGVSEYHFMVFNRGDINAVENMTVRFFAPDNTLLNSSIVPIILEPQGSVNRSIEVTTGALQKGNYYALFTFNSTEERLLIKNDLSIKGIVEDRYQIRNAVDAFFEIINEGSFNISDVLINITVPYFSYEKIMNVNISGYDFFILNISDLIINESTPKGVYKILASASFNGNIVQKEFDLVIPSSELEIVFSDRSNYAVQDNFTFTIYNRGGIDTNATLNTNYYLTFEDFIFPIQAGESINITGRFKPTLRTNNYNMFINIGDRGAGRFISRVKTINFSSYTLVYDTVPSLAQANGTILVVIANTGQAGAECNISASLSSRYYGENMENVGLFTIGAGETEEISVPVSRSYSGINYLKVLCMESGNMVYVSNPSGNRYPEINVSNIELTITKDKESYIAGENITFTLENSYNNMAAECEISFSLRKNWYTQLKHSETITIAPSSEVIKKYNIPEDYESGDYNLYYSCLEQNSIRNFFLEGIENSYSFVSVDISGFELNISSLNPEVMHAGSNLSFNVENNGGINANLMCQVIYKPYYWYIAQNITAPVFINLSSGESDIIDLLLSDSQEEFTKDLELFCTETRIDKTVSLIDPYTIKEWSTQLRYPEQNLTAEGNIEIFLIDVSGPKKNMTCNLSIDSTLIESKNVDLPYHQNMTVSFAIPRNVKGMKVFKAECYDDIRSITEFKRTEVKGLSFKARPKNNSYTATQQMTIVFENEGYLPAVLNYTIRTSNATGDIDSNSSLIEINLTETKEVNMNLGGEIGTLTVEIEAYDFETGMQVIQSSYEISVRDIEVEATGIDSTYDSGDTINFDVENNEEGISFEILGFGLFSTDGIVLDYSASGDNTVLNYSDFHSYNYNLPEGLKSGMYVFNIDGNTTAGKEFRYGATINITGIDFSFNIPEEIHEIEYPLNISFNNTGSVPFNCTVLFNISDTSYTADVYASDNDIVQIQLSRSIDSGTYTLYSACFDDFGMEILKTAEIQLKGFMIDILPQKESFESGENILFNITNEGGFGADLRCNATIGPASRSSSISVEKGQVQVADFGIISNLKSGSYSVTVNCTNETSEIYKGTITIDSAESSFDITLQGAYENKVYESEKQNISYDISSVQGSYNSSVNCTLSRVKEEEMTSLSLAESLSDASVLRLQDKAINNLAEIGETGIYWIRGIDTLYKLDISDYSISSEYSIESEIPSFIDSQLALAVDDSGYPYFARSIGCFDLFTTELGYYNGSFHYYDADDGFNITRVIDLVYHEGILYILGSVPSGFNNLPVLYTFDGITFEEVNMTQGFGTEEIRSIQLFDEKIYAVLGNNLGFASYNLSKGKDGLENSDNFIRYTNATIPDMFNHGQYLALEGRFAYLMSPSGYLGNDRIIIKINLDNLSVIYEYLFNRTLNESPFIMDESRFIVLDGVIYLISEKGLYTWDDSLLSFVHTGFDDFEENAEYPWSADYSLFIINGKVNYYGEEMNISEEWDEGEGYGHGDMTCSWDDFKSRLYSIDSAGGVRYSLEKKEDKGTGLSVAGDMDGIITIDHQTSEGGYVIECSLFNSYEQLLGLSRYEFTVKRTNYSLEIFLDKEIYSSDEEMNATIEVINNGDIPVIGYLSVEYDNVIDSNLITIPPRESFALNKTYDAKADKNITASFRDLISIEAIDVQPSYFNISFENSEFVGSTAQSFMITAINTGNITGTINLSTPSSNEIIELERNQTKQIIYEIILNDSYEAGDIYVFNITADIGENIVEGMNCTANLCYKEISAIYSDNMTYDLAIEEVYESGLIIIPFNITNNGLTDSSYNVTFTVEEQEYVYQFYHPNGSTIGIDLNLSLDAGEYTLFVNSPYMDDNHSLRIADKNTIEITILSNESLRENEDMTAIFRNIGPNNFSGEYIVQFAQHTITEYINLSLNETYNTTMLLNITELLPRIYNLTVRVKVGSNISSEDKKEIQVMHPVFVINQVFQPDNVSIGDSINLTINTENTGQVSGEFRLGITIPGISMKEELVKIDAGSEKNVTFTDIIIPDDLLESGITGYYQINDVRNGSFSINISGIAVSYSASLDRHPALYYSGENATLNLTLVNTKNLNLTDMYVRTRFSEYHDELTYFNLTEAEIKLSITIPISSNASSIEKLFFGVYKASDNQGQLDSSRSIIIDSIFIFKENRVTIMTDKQLYNLSETVFFTVNSTEDGNLTLSTLDILEINDSFGMNEIVVEVLEGEVYNFNFTLPSILPSASYNINYMLNTTGGEVYMDSFPFDVDGFQLFFTGTELDKSLYLDNDTMHIMIKLTTNRDVNGTLHLMFIDPEDALIGNYSATWDLLQGENLFDVDDFMGRINLEINHTGMYSLLYEYKTD